MALILSRLTPFSLVWGVRKGGRGGGGVFWAGGPNFTHDCHAFVFTPPDKIKKKLSVGGSFTALSNQAGACSLTHTRNGKR